MNKTAHKKIYVVLTRTGTKVAKLIRMYTHEPYSHVSISFDGNLDTLYSFARRGIHNPLNAGFIVEHIEEGIFGRDRNVECAVYCLEFPVEDYNRINRLIYDMLCHKEEYDYNFMGLFMAALNRPYSRPKHFLCSEFVAYVLGIVGVELVAKDYSLIHPENFRTCLDRYCVYEGNLHDYVVSRRNCPEMDSRSIGKIEYLKNLPAIEGRIAKKAGSARSYEELA